MITPFREFATTYSLHSFSIHPQAIYQILCNKSKYQHKATHLVPLQVSKSKYETMSHISKELSSHRSGRYCGLHQSQQDRNSIQCCHCSVQECSFIRSTELKTYPAPSGIGCTTERRLHSIQTSPFHMLRKWIEVNSFPNNYVVNQTNNSQPYSSSHV
jgi:hypothetical protein